MIKKIIYCFLTLTSAAFLFQSCADDLNMPTSEIENKDAITLLIPILTESQFDSRAESNVTGQEGIVNDLYLYVFKKTGSGNSDTDFTIVNGYQGLEISSQLKSGTTNNNDISAYKSFNVNLMPGSTYRFYLLGNVNKYTESVLSNISTIQAIKNLDLNFTDVINVADGLPMACLSSIQVGTSEPSSSAPDDSSVTVAEGNNIYCDMHFLCSKVRYTILFDNTQEDTNTGVQAGISSAFGSHVVDFSSEVNVSQIASSTNLKESKGAQTSYLNDNTSSPFTASLAKFDYPASNPGANVGNLSTASSNPNKCAWQGIVYLPENTNSNNKTKLAFNGSCKNSSTDNKELYEISHEVELIPNPCSEISHGSDTSAKNHGIDRSTFYDLTFKITSYEGFEITVSEANWTPQNILVDFEHTFLEIERTTASVTSIIDDVMTFNSDGRGGYSLICFNPDNLVKKNNPSEKITTPVIILGEVNEEEHTLTLSANSSLNIDEVAATGLKGYATCYIKAGNITKQIIVEYDLEAFFTITPESLTFNMGDKVDGKLPSQQFHFETNLGGLVIYKSDAFGTKSGSPLNLTSEITDQVTVINIGGEDEISKISLECETQDLSEGDIIVNVDENWNNSHVAHHYFWVEPATTYPGIEGNLIMVSVIPNQGDYRVYFRAINDYQAEHGVDYSNGNGVPSANFYLESNWGNFPTEDYNTYTSTSSKSNNWKDWWDNENTKDEIDKAGRHMIYIYGQIGETGGQFSSIDDWGYNDYNTGDKMSGDYTNPGWYYFDIGANWTTTSSKLKNKEDITPGRTLIIFHNRGYGAALHRCSHHNDPGVPLFNYEDREGWYLYDPTREPYYNVYDDKPEIEDVIYQFYTKGKPTEWFREYGLATGESAYDTHTKFRMHGDITLSTSATGLGQTYKPSDKDYYVTQLKFKAPKDDYSKNIKISVREGVQKVYVCVQFKWKDPTTPMAHFYKDDGSTYKGWEDEENTTMSPIDPPSFAPSDTRDQDWFEFEVPSGWENSKVIIHRKEYYANEWPSTDPLNDRSPIIYIKGDMSDWIDYNTAPSYSETNLTLMGGRNYSPESSGSDKIIYGYFNNNIWTNARPNGY